MEVAKRFYQYRDHFEVFFRMMDFTAWSKIVTVNGILEKKM